MALGGCFSYKISYFWKKNQFILLHLNFLYVITNSINVKRQSELSDFCPDTSCLVCFFAKTKISFCDLAAATFKRYANFFSQIQKFPSVICPPPPQNDVQIILWKQKYPTVIWPSLPPNDKHSIFEEAIVSSCNLAAAAFKRYANKFRRTKNISAVIWRFLSTQGCQI